MRVLLLFILAIITVTGVEAQVVRGIVRDSVSNEPMRSVTVKVDGTKKGVITNKNGEFTLRLAKGNYTFVFSFIGYKTERRNVSVVDSVNLKILLKEAPSSAAEVVVYGEDPAVRLMRKVIERKKRQQDSLQTYSYMLYTKFDASTDTVTAGRTSGRGDTTIVSIFESYSKGYYSKPDKYFNEIVQRRQTANIPPEANVVTFGTNTNGYDDYITFFNEQVATPFHPDAIDYYDFTILKTLQEDDTVTITRITVTPKGNGRKLFAGYIDIDEKNLIPIACKLKPNRAVQLPFDAALEYEQSFQRIGDMIVPQYMRIQGNVQIHLFWVINPRLDLNIETMAYDFTINQTLDNELFEQRRTEVSKVAEKFDSTYWQERSVMQLRPEEASAYKQIEQSLENNDSTVASGLFDQIFGWIPRTLSKLNRRPFTGIEDMLRYNRITGLYLGVGLLDTLAERWEATGKVGYGFSDKRWYGELGSKYYLDTNRKYSISAIAY
ncbi:MAG: carboxypeptidase-like regulatory domain-containing protein, partial [Candidatus Kapabacteria bacterium]|nr:carboxypeptidase-like regulatory domain-containing protein [Candidatus Kapabacteria bacterium]